MGGQTACEPIRLIETKEKLTEKSLRSLSLQCPLLNFDTYIVRVQGRTDVNH